MNQAALRFDLPDPHLLALQVVEDDIDAYQHVNNAVYVTWCDRVAWDHSAALGLPIERCLELDRGMAVVRTVINYLRPALRGDALLIATWILPAESRVCIRRRFQLLRTSDGTTLSRAEVEYACLELSSGRPTRWPAEFRQRYVVRPAVLDGLTELGPV
ncbi:acyl-CoA thioester hydrolase [Povalibacter uvarum]|uniref:Acyl-CoA thioester hydrolase n=1 Tax=Povalibacter uvarum TaxID=732238 RepID=A0A841HJJ8_9GAMM|nr:thioesterase family protein [Povalibacter uvarum]MBB6092480.1 acyl-CoA thioester hydrolase [Povalibacter uvarum]